LNVVGVQMMDAEARFSWVATTARLGCAVRTLRQRRVGLAGVAVIAAAVLGGCSTEQVYGAGQTWQRNQCEQLADANQRDRCIAGTDMTYPQYEARRRTAIDTP
jgi:hypothetical protein